MRIRTFSFFTPNFAPIVPHSGGSIVTFDPKSGILFTSDLFGSLGLEWELFLNLRPECMDCVNLKQCPQKRTNCPINDILNFHKTVMPSGKALRYSLEQILDIPFTTIAPQHGSIINDKEIMRYVFELLSTSEGVGIDGIVEYQNPDGQFYGSDRFYETLNSLQGQSVADIVAQSIKSLMHFGNPAKPLDDITLLGLELKNYPTKG